MRADPTGEPVPLTSATPGTYQRNRSRSPRPGRSPTRGDRRGRPGGAVPSSWMPSGPADQVDPVVGRDRDRRRTRAAPDPAQSSRSDAGGRTAGRITSRPCERRRGPEEHGAGVVGRRGRDRRWRTSASRRRSTRRAGPVARTSSRSARCGRGTRDSPGPRNRSTPPPRRSGPRRACPPSVETSTLLSSAGASSRGSRS